MLILAFSELRTTGIRGLTVVTSSLLYQHRDPRTRVDVVDLDPYGTAAPFIVSDLSSNVYLNLTG